MVDIQENEEVKKSWSNMPEELLSLIKSRLFVGDYNAFSAVCRSWRSTYTPVRPLPSPIDCPFRSSSCLMYIRRDNDMAMFFHPMYNDCYSMDIPELYGVDKILSARYGWLLVSVRFSIFFFNPFTREKIELPDIPFGFASVCFTSPPTFEDCVVIGFSGLPAFRDIGMLRRGQQFWDTFHFYNSDHFYKDFYGSDEDNEIDEHNEIGEINDFYGSDEDNEIGEINDFYGSDEDNEIDEINDFYGSDEDSESNKDDKKFMCSGCSPVLFNGLCYVLGIAGNIGVFDPKNPRWKVFVKPYELEGKSLRGSFLTELDGRLVAACLSHDRDNEVPFFSLDLTNKVWQPEQTIGDKMLYASHGSTFFKRAVINGMGNEIYFPYRSGKNGVFYSLSTKRFHSFAGDDTSTEKKMMREDCNAWIQPNFESVGHGKLTW